MSSTRQVTVGSLDLFRNKDAMLITEVWWPLEQEHKSVLKLGNIEEIAHWQQTSMRHGHGCGIFLSYLYFCEGDDSIMCSITLQNWLFCWRKCEHMRWPCLASEYAFATCLYIKYVVLYVVIFLIKTRFSRTAGNFLRKNPRFFFFAGVFFCHSRLLQYVKYVVLYAVNVY